MEVISGQPEPLPLWGEGERTRPGLGTWGQAAQRAISLGPWPVHRPQVPCVHLMLSPPMSPRATALGFGGDQHLPTCHRGLWGGGLHGSKSPPAQVAAPPVGMEAAQVSI